MFRSFPLCRAERRRPNVARAFTLVEMLVVISILSVLLAMLMPVFGSLRAAGRQTMEMNAARQLEMAYQAYAMDHRDRVLPGYCTAMGAKDPLGRRIDAGLISGRYPWRIAPYLNYNFAGMYLGDQADYLERQDVRKFSDEPAYYESSEYHWYLYRVSLYPSLGLNTEWLGGNEDEGAFDAGVRDVYGRMHVESLAEVRRPEKLIVFASARGADPFTEGAVHEGFFKLRSPYFRVEDGYRWFDEDPSSAEFRSPLQYGYLSPRYNGQVVVSFVDGHAEPMEPELLRDMRLWSNRANRTDWALEAAVGE